MGKCRRDSPSAGLPVAPQHALTLLIYSRGVRLKLGRSSVRVSPMPPELQPCKAKSAEWAYKFPEDKIYQYSGRGHQATWTATTQGLSESRRQIVGKLLPLSSFRPRTHTPFHTAPCEKHVLIQVRKATSQTNIRARKELSVVNARQLGSEQCPYHSPPSLKRAGAAVWCEERQNQKPSGVPAGWGGSGRIVTRTTGCGYSFLFPNTHRKLFTYRSH